MLQPLPKDILEGLLDGALPVEGLPPGTYSLWEAQDTWVTDTGELVNYFALRAGRVEAVFDNFAAAYHTVRGLNEVVITEEDGGVH